MEWSRPESIPYPNTWGKFKGLREIDGKIPEFWLQDATEDQAETVVKQMMTRFIYEEPICKYTKLAEDPVSVAEGITFYQHVLSKRLTVVCMTNDSEGKPIVAGMSCLDRLSKDDPPIKPAGESYGRLQELLDYAYSVKDPYTHLGITEYLGDKGIFVLPEYRGQGICLEFLKSWLVICNAVGLKAAVGSFTSIVSQTAADRAGFQELNSLPYLELGKLNPRFVLPRIEEHTKNLRLLYAVV